MPKSPNLSAQEIYEKEFGIDVKGYSASAVDDFLDLVIEDYQYFEDQLNYYADLVERYENRLNEMSLPTSMLRPSVNALNPIPASANVDQKDILERLEKLEVAVFGGANTESAEQNTESDETTDQPAVPSIPPEIKES